MMQDFYCDNCKGGFDMNPESRVAGTFAFCSEGCLLEYFRRLSAKLLKAFKSE